MNIARLAAVGSIVFAVVGMPASADFRGEVESARANA